MINRTADTLFRTLLWGVFFASVGLAMIFSTSRAEATTLPSAIQYARNIANTCLEDWKTLSCYSVVSDSNQILVTSYIAQLETAGHASHGEKIRQACAASTAITGFVKEGGKNLSVNAVSEAFTICANQISDTSEATHVKPDITYYQLLLIPTLCVRDDPRCGNAASSLRPFLEDSKKPQTRR